MAYAGLANETRVFAHTYQIGTLPTEPHPSLKECRFTRQRGRRVAKLKSYPGPVARLYRTPTLRLTWIADVLVVTYEVAYCRWGGEKKNTVNCHQSCYTPS